MTELLHSFAPHPVILLLSCQCTPCLGRYESPRDSIKRILNYQMRNDALSYQEVKDAAVTDR
jgi:hypothetical protein